MIEDDETPQGLLYEAWTVIANAAGWDEDTEWREAAIRWRDRWHQSMAEIPHDDVIRAPMAEYTLAAQRFIDEGH